MIEEIKTERPFLVVCDDCKLKVRNMAQNEESALPTGWERHVCYTGGQYIRVPCKRDLCPLCKLKPKWQRTRNKDVEFNDEIFSK